ncbi:MAG: hypothetical protein AAGG57_01335 [Pseudomonadota bacterium]
MVLEAERLAGVHLPAQSTVVVTRSITGDEKANQSSARMQMAYDTRSLLHYFSLMLDDRFLFGMRCSLGRSPLTKKAARAAVKRDFEALFPAWRQVQIEFSWYSMTSISIALMPFVSQFP